MNQETDHNSKGPCLYFAFPDGVFHYVCSECTALCCKGHGFGGSLEKELRPLFVLYPQIESMATKRVGDYFEFATPSSGCLLLDTDNRCRIEKEHSKAAKPSVCTLFPFNVLTLIGKAIAVSPHFLCPLRIQIPARPGYVEGTHSSLEKVIRSSPMITPEFMSSRKPRLGMHSETKVDSVLKREERFRDACSFALGQTRFADVLRLESADVAALDSFTTRASQLLGFDVSAQLERDSMDDVLLALAPSFRLDLLHLSSEGMLRALSLAELLYRRTVSGAATPLTLQAAHSILYKFAPTLSLLAHGNEPLDLPRSIEVKAPAFDDPEMVFAAFVALREARGSAGVLGSLEKVIQPSFSVSDRSVFLQQIGVEVEEAIKKRRKKK